MAASAAARVHLDSTSHLRRHHRVHWPQCLQDLSRVGWKEEDAETEQLRLEPVAVHEAKRSPVVVAAPAVADKQVASVVVVVPVHRLQDRNRSLEHSSPWGLKKVLQQVAFDRMHQMNIGYHRWRTTAVGAELVEWT